MTQLNVTVITAAAAATMIPLPGQWPPGAEVRMLYDGECSLCMKEVNFLRQRDASAGKIDFVDIALPSYRPEDNAGITFEQVGSRLSASQPGCSPLNLQPALSLMWAANNSRTVSAS